MIVIKPKGAPRTFELANIACKLPNGPKTEDVRVTATFYAFDTDENAKLAGLSVREYCEKTVASVDKLVGLKFASEDGSDLGLTGSDLVDACVSVFEIAVALRMAHVEAITKGAARKN